MIGVAGGYWLLATENYRDFDQACDAKLYGGGADYAVVFTALTVLIAGFSLGARTAVRMLVRGARPRRLALGGMGDSGLGMFDCRILREGEEVANRGIAAARKQRAHSRTARHDRSFLLRRRVDPHRPQRHAAGREKAVQRSARDRRVLELVQLGPAREHVHHPLHRPHGNSGVGAGRRPVHQPDEHRLPDPEPVASTMGVIGSGVERRSANSSGLSAPRAAKAVWMPSLIR